MIAPNSYVLNLNFGQQSQRGLLFNSIWETTDCGYGLLHFLCRFVLISSRVDAHHGILAARAIITPINTRLKRPEVDYIVEHSGCRILLVDHEYAYLVSGSKVPVVISNDTGRSGDPYEEFLTEGRRYSNEKGWLGLGAEEDENAGAVLCYTLVSFYLVLVVTVLKRLT